MELSQTDAAQKIQALLEAEGTQVAAMQVIPKANGVWLAEVRYVGSDEEHQGVFTEQALAG